MTTEPEVTVTKDQHSAVLGDLVTVNGVKVGRVHRADNGRTWSHSTSPLPGVYASGNWSRTKKQAVETLVRIALQHFANQEGQK